MESDHYFYDTKLIDGDESVKKDLSSSDNENWRNEEPSKRKSSPADTSHATNGHVSSSLLNPQHKIFAESLNFENNEGGQSTKGTFSDESATSVNASRLMEMFLRSGISLVLLITDGVTEQRVDQLAPQLASLLRGAAGLIVLFMERVPAMVLRRFEVESLTMPTMMFFPPFHMVPSAHVVNFEDPLEWVEEQLLTLQPQHPPDSTEGYSPLPLAEELQQDDEVTLSMVRESSLRAAPRLRGEDDLERKTRHSSSVMAVAYGYSWDASTNVLLQHLSELPLSLTSLRSNATVHRLDCYDHPAQCFALPHVPALKFHLGDKAMLYNGPLYAAAILRSILILETAWPVVNISEEHVSQFLNLSLFPSLKEVVGTAVLGVFPLEKGALDYTRAAEHFRQDILYAVTYATEDNARKWCLHSSTHSPTNCLIIVKKDQLQNHKILSNLPSNFNAIIKLLEKATLNPLEKLQPHRLMKFLSSSRERRKKSAFVVLLLAHGEDVKAVKKQNNNIVSSKEPENAIPSSTFKKNIGTSTPTLGQCVVDKCSEEKRSLEPETISSHAQEEAEPSPDRHEFSDQLKFSGTTGKSEALVGSELFVSVGHVAGKMTSDEMMFSWVPKNSSLAEAALSAWRCPKETSLVGLDVVASKVFCGGTYSGDAAVLGWVQDLLNGRLSETGVLSPTRWRPLLHGLDYLRLLEEEEEEGSNFQA